MINFRTYGLPYLICTLLLNPMHCGQLITLAYLYSLNITELMQNEALYKATQSIVEGTDYSRFNPAQCKVLDNALRDFKLAGVHLPPAAKARFAELQKQASKLSTRFSENILDATHAWTLHVTDPDALLGLPEQA